jgi:hypothetical protein
MSEFKFAMNLISTVAGNACVSPVNIAHALGLVALGSSDESRDEIVSACGGKNHEEFHATLSNGLKEIVQKGN